MFSNYKCPKCEGQLRLGNHVILTAFDQQEKGSIVLLHPEPGNYAVEFHPGVSFVKGEKVTFYCPICHKDLTYRLNHNLANVKMTDKEGKEFDIYFSRITGEHSTIKMFGEHVDLYGPDSKNYLDFFTLSQQH